MSERKVINKYFPPDFDPEKLPKGAPPKGGFWSVRMMLPYSVQCLNCGTFMSQGKKFNTKLQWLDEKYLGIRKARFLWRCTACANQFALTTNPQTADYDAEWGVKRLYQHHKALGDEADAKQAEKATLQEDAIAALEAGTERSRQDMATLDALEATAARAAANATMSPDEVIASIAEQRKTEQTQRTAAGSHGIAAGDNPQHTNAGTQDADDSEAAIEAAAQAAFAPVSTALPASAGPGHDSVSDTAQLDGSEFDAELSAMFSAAAQRARAGVKRPREAPAPAPAPAPAFAQYGSSSDDSDSE